jgi:hypothetical protein
LDAAMFPAKTAQGIIVSPHPGRNYAPTIIVT